MQSADDDAPASTPEAPDGSEPRADLAEGRRSAHVGTSSDAMPGSAHVGADPRSDAISAPAAMPGSAHVGARGDASSDGTPGSTHVGTSGDANADAVLGSAHVGMGREAAGLPITFDLGPDVRGAAQNRYVRSPLVPRVPKLADFSVADEADFLAAQQLLIDPPPSRQKTQLLVFSLLAFLGAALLGRGTASLVDLGLLVGVILFHELGHMAGMILFGYRDVKIFFIPFLGGAASGRKRGVDRWKEACVLLLGPLPGIIAGCIIVYVGGEAAQSGWVHTLAMQLVVVNALNLLPIAPLDGGQLFSVLIFSRNRHLELVFTAVTGALIGVLGVIAGIWVIAIIAWVVLASLPFKKRVMEAGEVLRDTGLPRDPAALTQAQHRRVWRTMWDRLPASVKARWRGRPILQARAMEEIVDRATLEPPGIEMTLGILGVWFVGLVIAGAGMMPQHGGGGSGGHWQVYRNPAPHFTVEFPTEARRIEGPQTLIEAGDCRLVYSSVEQQDGWLEKTAASPGRALRQTSRDREVRERGDRYTRAVLNNGIGFVLTGKGEQGKRFVESFHLLE